MKTIVLQLAIQVAANVIAALLIRKWESWRKSTMHFKSPISK